MSAVDYVKTPYMACPNCGGDPEWETKNRYPAHCDDVTVAEMMEGQEQMDMVGDCARCNYFIEVRIRRIVVDGAVAQRELPATGLERGHKVTLHSGDPSTHPAVAEAVMRPGEPVTFTIPAAGLGEP
jgi:hypothetical protein